MKELPALSRVGDTGALDCEGSSADRRVADRPGSSCSPVAVELRSVVITWDQSNQSPGICLGGSIMLVESRHMCERRLRPQAGYLLQRS